MLVLYSCYLYIKTGSRFCEGNEICTITHETRNMSKHLNIALLDVRLLEIGWELRSLIIDKILPKPSKMTFRMALLSTFLMARRYQNSDDRFPHEVRYCMGYADLNECLAPPDDRGK